MTNETTPSRFAAFNEAETVLIADGLDILQPDEDTARDMATELTDEARRHYYSIREARIAAEAATRAADYRTAEEARALRLLKANGFNEECGGGGATILSRYYPGGTFIWATHEDGPGQPTYREFCICLYAGPDMGEPLLDIRGNGGRDDPFLIDGLRQCLAAAAAVERVKAQAGPPVRESFLAALATDTAADVAEPSHICPPGFQRWTDGVAQGFMVYPVLDRGCVILSDLYGQEEASAESWTASVFTGEFIFDGDNAEGDRELRNVHDFTPENCPSVEAAIAAAVAMAEALPLLDPAPCEGHTDTGRGVCAECGQPVPESTYA